VRRVAAETGIDPSTVQGTGKGGRVTKGDLLAKAATTKASDVSAAVATAPASALPSTPPAVAAPSGERRSRRKMSKLRQTIASRLVSAQHEAAMLTTFNEVDMSAVMELRKKYQDDFTKRHGVKLGFMSFFTKAVVHALREVPSVNAQIDGDEIVQNHYYDISMAVSTEKGLVVPVVRGCDQLDMAGIEKAIADVAKRARDGKLTLPDFEGGCFTITNGGIFGSMLSTPIINAPQSAILGLHAINERPVAVNGQVVIRPMMYLALSYDHRLVDGKEAVTFLVKVKQAIEDPTRLLISV
jgi:2-oxoglutarate dehydrogenase E2 component (dihydrolipoamide succinyltransferase)